MSAQIPDFFLSEEDAFYIVALENPPLFCPEEYGLHPRMASTDCQRGYWNVYTVVDRQLILQDINAAADTYPAINGILPKKHAENRILCHDTKAYLQVRLPVAYSGGMLIARTAIPAFCVHMGFQYPHAYKSVYELCFQNGKYTGFSDLCGKMEQRREKLQHCKKPGPQNGDIHPFVEEMFRLDYSIKNKDL